MYKHIYVHICVYIYIYTFVVRHEVCVLLHATGFHSRCWDNVAGLGITTYTHTYMYTYIYIYICIHICLCICIVILFPFWRAYFHSRWAASAAYPGRLQHAQSPY